MKYTMPKGVFDILPKEPKEEESWRVSDHWNYLEETIRRCAADYGYKEIRTPLFERTELFVRGVGESSDIVSKEMYTFIDKGERSMTLRPEGTASVIRAFVEKHLDQMPGLHKYFYIGPMFRYERPQSGRYRQHHQFGAEAIGVGTAEQDAELIDLLCELYRRLGLSGLKVMLNTVGDDSTRQPFKEALTAYLQPHFDRLSAESQARFTKNILRILDSKDEGDQELLTKAPSIHDFLSDEARAHFEQLKHLLQRQKIPFEVNPKLVRGLDYYNKTVYEVVAHSLGAQNSIGGGGRYDGLISMLGGPPLPSSGFATGLERVLQTMVHQNCSFPPAPAPTLFLVPMGQKALDHCFELATHLRHHGIAVDIDLSQKKIQHGLQLADTENARFCGVIGDRELETGKIEIKEMKTRSSRTVEMRQLQQFLMGDLQ